MCGAVKLKKVTRMIIYKFVVEVAYIFFMCPLFSYSGFAYEFDTMRYLLSWMVFFLFVPCIIYTNINSCRKTDVILEIYLYLSIVPAIVLFEAGTVKGFYFFLDTIFWIQLFLFYNIFGKITFKETFRVENKYGKIIIVGLALLSVAVVLFICIRYSGFRLSFDLYNVYENRTEALNYSIPTLINYILGFSCAAVPVIIVFMLKEKKYAIGLFLMFIQLLNFGINGLKSTFAMTILTIVCYFFIKKSYLRILEIFFSLFGIACILERICFKSYYLIDFLLRRVFFVSSQLSFYYMDYFLFHEPDYFKTTILGRFLGFSSSYSKIPYMIGDIYMHKDVSANCGLVADAVTNLGGSGLFVFPVILAIFLLVLNKCVTYVDERVYFVAFIYIAYVINNAFFTTALLSHGILGLMIIMYILSKMEEEKV